MDKGSEFYNRSMKLWLQDNDIEMYTYYNTYYSTIKMNLADAKSSTYIDFGIENNDKDPKFKVGDHGRISKYFY